MLTELELPGVFAFDAPPFTDARGSFTKLLHGPTLSARGINFETAEMFTSRSAAGVVRGLHFQTPPNAHAKLVTCLKGEVLDVIVDLRRSSPSFGRALGVNLNEGNGRTLLIPIGCAHGFMSRSEDSIMLYATTREHVPAADAGLLWSSIPFEWGITDPILSDRDRKFPKLEDYESPFD